MFNKHKTSNQLETLARQITGSTLAYQPESYEPSYKAWSDFYYTFPNWNTTASFVKRFDKLATFFPQLEEQRPVLAQVLELAKQLAEFAASEKARLAAKRAKLAEPKPVLASGVKLEQADPEVVKTLLEGLATNRSLFVVSACNNKHEQIKDTLAKALDGTFAQSLNSHSSLRSQVFAEWGLYNDETTCEKLAARLSNQKVVDGYLAKAQKEAEFEFDSYVIKLAGKVTREGATKVLKATMAGNVWAGVLSVETDANHQTWNTQCIINTSPLGKLFHQWPTILKSLTAK